MKTRLDSLIVSRGLVQSRERAKALIMEGKVLVDGLPAAKAGTMVGDNAGITIKEDMPYVSRGGLKLERAIEHFNIDLDGKVAMDVGASTGGFTDCMLQRGAARVYAIDVGYGQLDWNLRNDTRVVVMEKVNMRHLRREEIPEAVDFACIDVSFISLRLIVPKVREFMRPGGSMVALIKPQFEVGKGEVGKGGIVRDEKVRLATVKSIVECFDETGLRFVGTIESPITGQKGNIEDLL